MEISSRERTTARIYVTRRTNARVYTAKHPRPRGYRGEHRAAARAYVGLVSLLALAGAR